MSYNPCNACPRKCGINREQKQTGFCKESSELRIATAMLHFGEEPPITAANGSGTIFVTGCNLRCAFCQNYQISQQGMGKAISEEECVDIFFQLEDAGAENINIVTGSHVIPIFAKVIEQAKNKGLSIPVCWNSSSYETIEQLETLEGLVDIWLPDMKTLNPLIADSVFHAADYPSVAKKAIKWMISHTQRKFIKLDKPVKIPGSGDAPMVQEKMLSGVIIRHLVLPGRIDDTKLVLDWLKVHADSPIGFEKNDNRACISLMSQYTPVNFTNDTKEQSEIRNKALNSFQNRLLKKSEFEKIRNLIDEYDFDYLFYQELDDDTGWLPDFNKEQPFFATLAKPIWYWNQQN